MRIALPLFALFALSTGFIKIDFEVDTSFRDLLDSVSGGCEVPEDDKPLNPPVGYYLYTQQKRDGQQLTEDTLAGAEWSRSDQLKVLIHGYWNNKDSPFNTKLRDEYLNYGDYNIIVVDWGAYTKSPCNLQARSSINPVGEAVTAFLKKVLEHRQFNPVHLLGHSLGAHVAARVSSRMAVSPTMPRVHRLTKFDPANPLFIADKNDRGVADFTDVYHSNSGVLGQETPQGDVDVYLNNFMFQPGCECDVSCSHMRSVEYFAESIKAGPNGMPALRCDSYLDFIGNLCNPPPNSPVPIVGDYINTDLRGKFLVFGKDRAPFLYTANDYSGPLDHFKQISKPECDENDIKQKVKDFLAGK